MAQMDETDGGEDALRTVPGRRIGTASDPPAAEPVEEELQVVLETPVVIDVAGVGSYTILCTPHDKLDLAAGFLLSESLIESLSDIASLKLCDYDPDIVRVQLADGARRAPQDDRSLLISSSCGLCGSEKMTRRLGALPKVGSSLRISKAALRRASEHLGRVQKLFARCGGTHAAGIFEAGGELLAYAEDAGRHTALDKAVGKCLRRGLATRGSGAMLSGRVSMEMVGKCARAGIEILGAISAPTSLAVDLARRCNITLCVFVREQRATILTHPDRIG